VATRFCGETYQIVRTRDVRTFASRLISGAPGSRNNPIGQIRYFASIDEFERIGHHAV
jgi:hypothetical protein